MAAPAFNLRPSDKRLAGYLEEYPSSFFGETLYQSIELMERYSIDLAIDLLERLNVLEQLRERRAGLEPARLVGRLPSRLASAPP